MRTDLTDITVVLDRSGSMQSCRSDAEGGLNNFVQEQKKAPGHALFTLVQFDHEYEFVHNGISIQDVPQLALVPRGRTAMYDAIGRAINETGKRLGAMPEDQRPGLVVFVILTDGAENASREFKQEQIKAMIELQQSQYQWKFIYLGANQNAIATASGIGVEVKTAGGMAVDKMPQAYSSATGAVLRGRAAVAALNTGEAVAKSMAFTDTERRSMQGK
jgi:hypothetical protein